MFTQRHYNEIAKILKKHEDSASSLYPMYIRNKYFPAYLIEDFVLLFEHDNPKFNTTKFLNAIYGEEVNEN